MSMKESLRAKFLGQFLQTAKARVTAAQGAVSSDDSELAASEAHSLAGEAAMLGFDEIGDLARAAERQAKEWHGGNAALRVKCGRSVRGITRAIQALEASSPVVTEQGTSSNAASSEQPRVLVIDDSELVAEQLREGLEDRGYVVRTTLDFDGSLVQAEEFKPTIILTDLNMPGVDCRKLVTELRVVSPSAKLILVSGVSNAELEVSVQDLSADGHISKQAGLEAILADVTRHIEGKT